MDYNKIILRLRSGGKSLDIGKGQTYKLLSKPEGIEGTDYTVDTEKNNQYDGSKVKNKRIEERPISLEFEYERAGINTNEREFIIGFFNPKQTGNLTVDYGGYKKTIDYEVVSVKDKQENIYGKLSFLVELTCPDPFFKDIEESSSLIRTWIGGWEWKFSLPFSLKKRGPQEAVINNEGHVPTPVQVEFPGPAYYPQVVNKTTGEFIKVRVTLDVYDVLYINTDFGKKTVEISRSGGEKENAFDLIDLDSDFFDLEVGENVIEFKVDNAETLNQEVQLSYRNRFVGV